MEKDDGNNRKCITFFVTFDEAEFNGDKFWAVRLGKLDSDGVHKPFLVVMTRDFKKTKAY